MQLLFEQITSRSWGSIFRRNFSRMYIQVFSSHLLFKVCLMQGDFKAIKIRIVFYYDYIKNYIFLSIWQFQTPCQSCKHKYMKKEWTCTFVMYYFCKIVQELPGRNATKIRMTSPLQRKPAQMPCFIHSSEALYICVVFLLLTCLT